MKAEITSDGTLTIIPESQTESYALKQWYRMNYVEYSDMDSSTLTTGSLIIKSYEETNGNKTTF